MALRHSLGFLTSLLIFVQSLRVFSLPPSSLSTQEDNPCSPLSPRERYRQGLHVMKPRPWPYPSNADHLIHDSERRRRMRRRRRGAKRKPGYVDLGATTFSAMLPRGFVPPSDSSWCQNGAPDSINIYCAHESTSRP
ncbi:hypothetical protein B296_00021656 [Ensete ventricosum]|uniref:Uncharacterized protein n=1 Tax=Ensete ventricosum TaxID=4639 RepID=A0A426YJF6_ENSVE|nr:hypothetical protein B296_00021656 [Ensete ventricosum]